MRWREFGRRLFGGPIVPGTGPILAVIATGVTAQYAFYGFFALYALERLDMRESSVGFALLGATLGGMVMGFVGGRVSDLVGRRPLIVAGSIGQAILPFLLVQPNVDVRLALAVLAGMSLLGSLRMAPLFALVVDVVADEDRERAFAANRIAYNVAALTGPLVGAALVAVDWRALHAGVAVLYVLSLLASLRLPRPTGARGSARQLLSLRIFADRRFVLLFGAACAATITYNAFETLLPVSLTQSHGLSPSTWGVLFVINPIVVMLMQMRVTRWSAGIPPATKLAVALVVMGFAFMPLLVSAAPFVLVAIVLVFVTGEMLWAPTADALVGRAAPADGRGAFVGTLGMASGAGAALAPAIGLHVRAASGDLGEWLMVGAVSVVAAALYVAAAHAHSGAREEYPSRCPPSPGCTSLRLFPSGFPELHEQAERLHRDVADPHAGMAQAIDGCVRVGDAEGHDRDRAAGGLVAVRSGAARAARRRSRAHTTCRSRSSNGRPSKPL